jgi:DNA-binding response OmpR family regulator
VEQLRYVKRQIEAGMSAADAHRLLDDELGGGRARTTGSHGEGGRPLVLIAERDPYAADLAEHLLVAEGCDVCRALDADGARHLFEERSPRVVIVDLLISGGAGLRLCRELSGRDPAQVLAVSALDSADSAVGAGASVFIRKPLEPRELVAVVRDLLGTGASAR